MPSNNEYIKPIFLDAQIAFSDLEFSMAFTPDHVESSVKNFYDRFNRLFNCTRYFIKKSTLLETAVVTNDMADNDKIINDTKEWFKSSNLNKIDLDKSKKLFEDYSWLVVNNLL